MWRRGPVCACTRVCWCCQIFTYIRHTHSGHTDRENTPDTGTHSARQDPQTNTSHKHLTTLNGGATTVRATSHARGWVAEWLT